MRIEIYSAETHTYEDVNRMVPWADSIDQVDGFWIASDAEVWPEVLDFAEQAAMARTNKPRIIGEPRPHKRHVLIEADCIQQAWDIAPAWTVEIVQEDIDRYRAYESRHDLIDGSDTWYQHRKTGHIASGYEWREVWGELCETEWHKLMLVYRNEQGDWVEK